MPVMEQRRSAVETQAGTRAGKPATAKFLTMSAARQMQLASGDSLLASSAVFRAPALVRDR